MLVALAIAGIVFPLNYYQNRKELAIRESVSKLNEIYINFVKDLRYSGEFMSLDFTDPSFFISGESKSLNAHAQLKDSLLALIRKCRQNQGIFSPVSDSALNVLEMNYVNYCHKIDELAYLIYRRGYRNFGLEGDLKRCTERMEKAGLSHGDVLELQKRENEYSGSNDTESSEKLREHISNLLGIYTKSPIHSMDRREKLKKLLLEYNSIFDQLVQLDEKIGLKNGNGMKALLLDFGDQVENTILSAIENAHEEEKIQLARLNTIFAVLSIILLISTIGLSIFLSRHLVNHLEKLTRYISQLSSTNFSYTDEKLALRRSSTEIRAIYREFRNMVAQIRMREKQRDQAYQELRENESRYRELAEMLPQSIFETDKMGNLVYANKAWHKIFGFTHKDIEEGLNLIEILQTNNDNNLFGINRVENSDYIAIRKDGSRFPVQVFSDTITKDNLIAGRRGIIIDATLRNKYIEGLQRETAKAVNSDKMKSSYLANMSHEIRTPMNSIIGFANLLATPGIPEDQKAEFVAYIQSSGKMLLNLIDDIIDVAKIEAGEIKIQSAPCRPIQIIHELLSTFEGYKTTLGKQEIELEASLPDDEIVFRSDAFRLRQIMSNLISNAIKFTDKGKVTISLSIRNERMLEFAVEDTGVGMTKEELNIIFERFSRTQRSEDKNIAGTGLGLTISKNLVELLGGKLWVSSVQGEGSRFRFQLPYTKVMDTAMIRPAGQQKSGNELYLWEGRTLLIAEDDEKSYIFLKEILQNTGIRIVHAVNGKEVVEAVKFTDKIDMVLLDIQMPFLDGYEAAKAIKQLRPNLPIIAQTAMAMESDREKCIMAGCDDYLAKPLNPSKLLAKMSQFMPTPPPGPEFTAEKEKKEKAKERIKKDPS